MSKHGQGRQCTGWGSGRVLSVPGVMVTSLHKGIPRIPKTHTHRSLSDGGSLNTCGPRLYYLWKGPQPPVVPGEGASPLTRKRFWGGHTGGGKEGQWWYKCPQRQKLCQDRIREPGKKKGCDHPLPSPRPSRPRTTSYITPSGVSPRQATVQAARTAPATGGRSSPTAARDPSRARGAATASASHGLDPWAFGFRPWRSHTPETNTQTP